MSALESYPNAQVPGLEIGSRRAPDARSRNHRFPAAILVLAWLAAFPADRIRAQSAPEGAVSAGESALSPEGYYRFPSLHGETIVFTAEGDLWRVSTSGGTAGRLTSHSAQEVNASLSPDGRTVAFSANYEGPTEVYTMPLSGGLPTRRTWIGRRATVVGWTPGGEILFATAAYSALPNVQLLRLDPRTGSSTMVPLSQASEGCYDATGKTLYFTRLPFIGSYTKRYQGGTAQNIWRFTEGDSEAVALTPDYPGTSHHPMLWSGRIYFVSDRDGTMNIWSMSPEGRDLRQHTQHQGWDARSASLSEGRIVYQLGADLYLYDIAADRTEKCPIRLASDFDQMRETWVQKPTDYLTSVHPSPDGDRIVLTARGLIFVAPAKNGRLVEVTPKHGVRYRGGRFFPDGKSVLALSDETGEVEFVRLPANGVGPEQALTQGGQVLRFEGIPSQNGKWIAYQDKNMELWVAETAKGQPRRVDRSPEGSFGSFSFSPDSRWLAYVKTASNQFSQILLYHLADSTITPLTTDRFDSYSPAWSPDGKWIYFLSDRTLRSVTQGIWGSRQPEPFFDRATKIYLVPLQTGLRSPFLAPDELHPPEEAEAAADSPAKEMKGEKKKNAKKETEEKDTRSKNDVPDLAISLQGIEARIQEVPAPEGNYESLSVNDGRLFFISRDTAANPKKSLLAYEIGWEKKETMELAKEIEDYELAADGKKLQIRKESSVYLLDASSEGSPDLAKFQVDLSGWTFPIDPKTERRHMFQEAWRLERDYFYDPDMHGVDWKGIFHKYSPLAERVTDRAELSDLLGEMVGELSALHIYVFGGDLRKGSEKIEPAFLGAELVRDEEAGGYRVGSIYESDPDLPQALSPLKRPGEEIREGEVIESLNGIPLLSVPDPGVPLRNQGGKQVLARVRSANSKSGRKDPAREVLITPLTAIEYAELRYASWEYGNRKRVEALADGKIGYVHLRAMGSEDYAAWSREFYPVYQSQGLIIDVRGNNGGNIDSWILEKLLRRAWMWWVPRKGNPFANMPYAFSGHMAVLCDENTVSDGEAFAEGFRRLGLGKVIGTRTWGGEIWLSMSNQLVDNGIATAAETGVYGPEGEWLIEGHGVDPDIVVDNPPHAAFLGKDAQLEAAVKHLQELIRTQPVRTPPPPPYPDKSAPATRPGGR